MSPYRWSKNPCDLPRSPQVDRLLKKHISYLEMGSISVALLGPGARFSKVPIINGPGKLPPFTLKIEVFNSFVSNVIKLSVNETKWSSLLARTRALILYISIWIFDFGPEKLPGLSRNGPLNPTSSPGLFPQKMEKPWGRGCPEPLFSKVQISNMLESSLPADVLWGSFIRKRNDCVTNEPQRTSAGRLARKLL